MFEDQALITRERAIATIGQNRLAMLRGVQRRGWSEWEAIRKTKEGSTLGPSGRARIVYEATARLATEVFPAYQCTWRHGLLVLDLEEVLVRFKKVNDEFVPRGIPTYQATIFEEQGQFLMPQRTLWPPKPMLIVGYVVDDVGMSIKRQALILRRGRVMWWHDLDAESGQPELPATLPTPSPISPAPATVRTRREQEAEREVR